ATLDLDLPLVRRDPHYFLPTLDGRSLLLGGSRDAARRQFVEFFSEADAKADEALGVELAMLREDLAPAWLAPPLPLGGTADRSFGTRSWPWSAARRWTTSTGSGSPPKPCWRCTR